MCSKNSVHYLNYSSYSQLFFDVHCLTIGCCSSDVSGSLDIGLACFELWLVFVVVVVAWPITAVDIEAELATVGFGHSIVVLVVALPFVVVRAAVGIGIASLIFKLEQSNFFIKLLSDLNHFFYSDLVIFAGSGAVMKL